MATDEVCVQRRHGGEGRAFLVAPEDITAHDHAIESMVHSLLLRNPAAFRHRRRRAGTSRRPSLPAPAIPPARLRSVARRRPRTCSPRHCRAIFRGSIQGQ
jgi:hypothetical protein